MVFLPVGLFTKTDESQSRRTLVLVALAVALLVVVLALRFARLHAVFYVDSWFLVFLRAQHSHLLESASSLLYSSVDLPIWDAGVLLVGLMLWLSRRRIESILLILGLSVDVAVELMKLMENPIRFTGRPLEDLLKAANLGDFPSGHTARVAVTLGLLVVLFSRGWKRWRIPALSLIFALLLSVGTASIRSGGHSPSDILGAYLLAALWVDLLLLVKTLSVRQQAPLLDCPPDSAPGDRPWRKPNGPRAGR